MYSTLNQFVGLPEHLTTWYNRFLWTKTFSGLKKNPVKLYLDNTCITILKSLNGWHEIYNLLSKWYAF